MKNLVENKKAMFNFTPALERIVFLCILASALIIFISFCVIKKNSISRAEEIRAPLNVASAILSNCAQNLNFDSIVSAENLDFRMPEKNYKYDLEVSDVIEGKLKLVEVKIKLSNQSKNGNADKNYVKLKRMIRKQ